MRSIVILATLAVGACAPIAPPPPAPRASVPSQPPELIGTAEFSPSSCYVQLRQPNANGWTVSFPSPGEGGSYLHLRHQVLRTPTERGSGVVVPVMLDRTALQAQHTASFNSERVGNLISLRIAQPDQFQAALRTARRVSVDLPQFGRQDFDLTGMREALERQRQCTAGRG